MHPASSGAFDANSGRRGRTFGGGPAFCRNYHQPARVLGMNGLDDWLAEQFRARNWRRIRVAHREALAVLIPGPDAHDNVARWLETHPGHRAVRGWLMHLDAFRGHSVVDTGVEWFGCYTPRVETACDLRFLWWRGTDGHRNALRRLAQEVARCWDYWPSARSTIFRTGRLLVTPLMPRRSRAAGAAIEAETLARLSGACMAGLRHSPRAAVQVARARRHPARVFRRPDDPGAEAFQHAFLGCVRPHGAARAHGNPAPL